MYSCHLAVYLAISKPCKIHTFYGEQQVCQLIHMGYSFNYYKGDLVSNCIVCTFVF